MIIKKFVNQILDSNCYLIIQPEWHGTIVVDPGDSNLIDLLSYMAENELYVEYVIFTHEHFDHIAGGKKLKEKYNCMFIASEESAEAMINPKKNFSIFYDDKPYISPAIDLTIEKLDYVLNWNSCDLKFYKTPGHSKGSICLHMENYFFTGDTLIKDIKTMTTLPGGSKLSLKKSLELIISLCNNETVILPGHKDIFRFEHVDLNKIL
jgi:hydroxyacylglutathione hydrolase